MAEDVKTSYAAPRDEWLFTHLFRIFWVAIDPKKLFIAAAGILVMAISCWLLSWIFYGMYTQPAIQHYALPSEAEYANNPKYSNKSQEERNAIRAHDEQERDRKFNEDSERWLLFHYLAGTGYAEIKYLPDTRKETRGRWGGRLRTWPWFEERGPNPYLLATGQTERPWERGQFADWALRTELPVLIEPVVKFLLPVIYLLDPKAGAITQLYLVLIILVTLATWALFGGVITRMAAVELAGKDPISVPEAVRFVLRRYISYLMAPLVPLILVALLLIASIVFGAVGAIPVVGDIFVSGLFWWGMIIVGVCMAGLLVGLVGYPMMYPTISTEGSDTIDALTRSYNYVFQSPWSYLWYALVTLVYGAVVIFFIGFMGSLGVYLSKWAVGNTPWIKSQTINRSPEYLFARAPTSFGWREMLLTDSPAEDWTRYEAAEDAVRRRHSDLSDDRIRKRLEEDFPNAHSAHSRYVDWRNSFHSWEEIGSLMVAFWVSVFFLLVLGFGYSFFWTASTMIYLLMRRRVDDMDTDEVYLEEMETTDIFGGGPTTPLPTTAAPPTPPVAGVGTTQVQETLTVRSDRSASEPPPPTDGSAPPPSAGP